MCRGSLPGLGKRGGGTRSWKLRGGAPALWVYLRGPCKLCQGPDLWSFGTLRRDREAGAGIAQGGEDGTGGLVPQHMGRSACRQNPVTRERCSQRGCPEDTSVIAECLTWGSVHTAGWTGRGPACSGSVAGFRPFLYALCAGTWSHRPGRL